MKTALSSLFIAVLIAVGAVEYAAAQPGPGGMRGPGGPGMFGDQGGVISDALVLKADRAEKITAVFEAQRETMRERFTSGDRPDFQNMSQEERMEFFQKMRADSLADTVERLSKVLSKDEVEFVKPLIEMRGARPDAQIRALRMIDISDATREKLQTLALIYFNTVASVQPEFAPGPPQGGQGRGRGQRGGFSDEDRKTIETARESMIADATKTLTDEEIKAWEKKTSEVEKEMESQRQQRGQGRQGRGQGGAGGQGRGQ
ncbi:MAG: hypothetical protein P9L94_13565 [Candidatus Hinthialibacter antarcticus]|nr:hypothetical protein [Candidatus Hinthialibacter antarcticus]